MQSKYLLFRQTEETTNMGNLYELNDLSNVIQFCGKKSYRSSDLQNTDASTGNHFFKKKND